MTLPRTAPPRDDAESRTTWRRTAAWYRVPGIAVLAVSLGLAFGRADLVLLIGPLLLGWVLAVGARRTNPRLPTAVAELARNSEHAAVTAVTGLDDVEFACVVQPDRWRGAIGAVDVIAGGRDARLTERFRTADRGKAIVARPDSLGIGPDGLTTTGSVRRGDDLATLVLPAVATIAPLQIPPILGGWTGAHVSRRPGHGSDFVDLREFTPGDRLRSIHWRAYARHQRLYTRRTLSDADAGLMICLDLSAVIAPRQRSGGAGLLGAAWQRIASAISRARQERAERADPAAASLKRTQREWDRASSVDHAVAAAVALAAAHLAQGDRVGVMTASAPRLWVRPDGGSRHLTRIRSELAAVESRPKRLLNVPWWGLRGGQIVVWCSPLTSAAAVHAARQCAARGHRVIVVDTLPIEQLLRTATADDADHLRILSVQRQLWIDELRGSGIGVVRWLTASWQTDVTRAARDMRGRR